MDAAGVRVHDMVCMAGAGFGILGDGVSFLTNEIGRDFTKGVRDGQEKKAAGVVAEAQPYIEGVAKNLVDRIYGPQGLPWGTKLAELEDMVVAVRQVLSEKMLGDGSDNNWTIWRNYFSSFVPILDFIHALSYVFAAALAGRKFAAGWPIYEQWIRWGWSGEVAQVIAALAQRQLELGKPEESDGETSPRQVVAQALTYLQNHQSQMKYAAYRKQGLPITSSYVESAVKQFNKRVKGTEKFWSETGAEAILQLRADHLSDDEPMQKFWQDRQASQTGQRAYRRAA
jgi:hypothetical protein